MERRDFIKTMVLSVGVIMCDGFCSPGKTLGKAKKSLNLHMIFNNIGGDPKYLTSWGLAIWIEAGGKSILFDTGGDEAVLFSNLQQAGYDLKNLSAIFISHNHWDHVSGLSRILRETDYRPTVFVPASELTQLRDKERKAKFRAISEPTELIRNVWSTGELNGRNPDLQEQSLILVHENMLYIITGCSHPGVFSIVERAKSLFPGKSVALVAGGFHMLKHSLDEIEEVSAKLATQNIELLAPSHCTGETVTLIFKDEWKERCIDFNNGDVLRF